MAQTPSLSPHQHLSRICDSCFRCLPTAAAAGLSGSLARLSSFLSIPFGFSTVQVSTASALDNTVAPRLPRCLPPLTHPTRLPWTPESPSESAAAQSRSRQWLLAIALKTLGPSQPLAPSSLRNGGSKCSKHLSEAHKPTLSASRPELFPVGNTQAPGRSHPEDWISGPLSPCSPHCKNLDQMLHLLPWM